MKKSKYPEIQALSEKNGEVTFEQRRRIYDQHRYAQKKEADSVLKRALEKKQQREQWRQEIKQRHAALCAQLREQIETQRLLPIPALSESERQHVRRVIAERARAAVQNGSRW